MKLKVRKRRAVFVGAKIGQLEVLAKARPNYWRCRCFCGRETVVYSSNLRHGRTKSCGRHSTRGGKYFNSYHAPGASSHPLFGRWKGILHRCHNPKQPHYFRYGGRGITVCERWLSFRNFVEDVGLPPSPKHTIDRIDNSKGYYPENVRWATWDQQEKNKRISKDARLLTFNGKTLTIFQWARKLGIGYATLYHRLVKAKWPIALALTAEIGLSGPKPKTK